MCWIFCKVHAREPSGISIEVKNSESLFYKYSIYQLAFQPLLTKEGLWKFDRSDFKQAVTLLLLNDMMEKDENDLELKKLIRLQFENDMEMLKWAADLFDKVRKLHPGDFRVYLSMVLNFSSLRSLTIYQIT